MPAQAMKRTIFGILLVFLLGAAAGVALGLYIGDHRATARADLRFTALCRENVDLNARLIAAETMIAAQARERAGMVTVREKGRRGEED